MQKELNLMRSLLIYIIILINNFIYYKYNLYNIINITDKQFNFNT